MLVRSAIERSSNSEQVRKIHKILILPCFSLHLHPKFQLSDVHYEQPENRRKEFHVDLKNN